MIKQHMLLPALKALEGSEASNRPGLQLKRLSGSSLICLIKPS
jgi:hypothetical protein